MSLVVGRVRSCVSVSWPSSSGMRTSQRMIDGIASMASATPDPAVFRGDHLEAI
jgi:hypothetical protein